MEQKINIAHSIEEAKQFGSTFRAGATDIIALHRLGMKADQITDIENIDALDGIEVGTDGQLRIGPMVRLADLGKHATILRAYPGLAKSANGLATPQIRSVASLGGNLLQKTRCAYFRNPRFSCYKKGGHSCPSRTGQHLRGVCFDYGPCVAPHPSTMGMALLAYDAIIEINQQQHLAITNLYGDGTNPAIDHTLPAGDLLTAIIIPVAFANEKAAYLRAISRHEAEWPLVEVLVRLELDGQTIQKAAISAGGVANIPIRLQSVEEALVGGTATPSTFEKVARLAGELANPLPMTAYKVKLLEGTLKAALAEAL